MNQLIKAAYDGNERGVKLHLAEGSGYNINDQDDRGSTALMLSSLNGHTAVVKLLLKRGSDVSVRGEKGTALMHATVGGFVQIITMLLDAGACVDETDDDGQTALIAAAVNGRCGAVTKLLERGAKVNHADKEGKAALHIAAKYGFADVVDLLIKAGAIVDQKALEQYTPLHYASGKGHDKCAWLLLRAGARVSAVVTRPNGFTSLHLASAVYGHVDAMEVLLSAGAEPDATNGEGHTALVATAMAGHDKAVKLLIDARGDPNKIIACGNTALFFAKDLSVVKLLLEGGASAKIINSDEWSLLHTAARLGRPVPVVCAFFKYGADPTLRDRRGRTAADVAREHGHSDLAKMLLLLEAKHRELRRLEEEKMAKETDAAALSEKVASLDISH